MPCLDFFTQPIEATQARKLGELLLVKSQENTKLNLKSFDRMFPNQDTLPKGGFGNLIALPLQLGPRKQGFSVFVNRDFQPYPDQIEI